jgi:hypothetical protein
MYGKGQELEMEMRRRDPYFVVATLVEKHVLSNTEVRTVLTKAATELGPHDYTAPVKGAIGIILDDVLPQFPENGGN